MKLGEHIRALRLSLGLTMKEFGEKLNPPASDSIVSRWERGVNLPNNERLKQLAEMSRNTEIGLVNTFTMIIENAVLKEENKRLRAALEEYAAKGNYEREAYDPEIYEGGYVQNMWEPSWIEFDKGETARKALEGESK